MKKYGSKKQSERMDNSEKLSEFDNKIDGIYGKMFDIKLFSRDKFQVLNLIKEKLASGTKKYWIATVNPEFVMETLRDNEFKQVLGRTSLNIIDGVGLVWAHEFIKLESYKVYKVKNKLVRLLVRFGWGIKLGVEVLKGKYRGKVASGADLMLDMVKMAKERDKKIFLLGGWGDRAMKVAKFLSSKFLISNEKIDWCAGEPEISNSEVVKKINSFKPDILLVAYGMKKQEFWINDNLKNLDVGLVMGVGRSFDYYSGELKRAPERWRKMGMEWLYSLIKEPKRIKRQLVLPKFVWKVLTSK